MIIVEHRQEAASLKGELAALKKRYLERERREQQAAAGAPAQALAAGANPTEGQDPTLPARGPAAEMGGLHDGAGRLHVQGETSPRGRAAERAASVPQISVAAAHAPSGIMEAGTPGSGATESSAAEATPALAAAAEQAPRSPAAAAPGLGLEEGAASNPPVPLQGVAGVQPERPDMRWWATDADAGRAPDATTGTAAEPAVADRPLRVFGEAEPTGEEAE